MVSERSNPYFKSKVQQAYIEGKYDSFTSLARQFGISCTTLKNWIKDGNWKEERERVWAEVTKYEESDIEDIKKRNNQHRNTWSALQHLINQIIKEVVDKKLKITPSEINQLAMAMERVQRGHHIADNVSDSNVEEQIIIEYTGLRNRLIKATDYEEVKNGKNGGTN